MLPTHHQIKIQGHGGGVCEKEVKDKGTKFETIRWWEPVQLSPGSFKKREKKKRGCCVAQKKGTKVQETAMKSWVKKTGTTPRR